MPNMKRIYGTGVLLILLQSASIAQQKSAFLSLKATPKNDSITVEWSIANDRDAKEYRIEKSTGASKFNMLAIIPAFGNDQVNNYTWYDGQPSKGSNYYRITNYSMNGAANTSRIVSVYIGKYNEKFSIYPNPVQANIFTLSIVKDSIDEFTVRLLSSSGQLIKVYSVSHPGGISSQTLELPGSLPNDV